MTVTVGWVLNIKNQYVDLALKKQVPCFLLMILLFCSGGLSICRKEKCFGSPGVFFYRFVIESKDTFFSPAQRSLLVYQILLRCVFEDHAEKSKCKFGELF